MDFSEKLRVKEFYDSISCSYDEQLKDGIIANIIRKTFQNKLLNNFKPGSKLLELGCGTGTDSVFLAKHGIYVSANDISPGMIHVALEKIRSEELNSHLKVCVKDSEEAIINSKIIYDGVISNFDCVNYLDISALSTNLLKITGECATIQFTLLNKKCLWEFVYYLLKLQPLKALRYFKNREKFLFNILDLKSPGEIIRNFSPDFRIKKITGIGLLIPPDGLKGLQKRFPGFFGRLEKLDMLLASVIPFCNFCDHYIIEMEKVNMPG